MIMSQHSDADSQGPREADSQGMVMRQHSLLRRQGDCGDKPCVPHHNVFRDRTRMRLAAVAAAVRHEHMSTRTRLHLRRYKRLLQLLRSSLQHSPGALARWWLVAAEQNRLRMGHESCLHIPPNSSEVRHLSATAPAAGNITAAGSVRAMMTPDISTPLPPP